MSARVQSLISKAGKHHKEWKTSIFIVSVRNVLQLLWHSLLQENHWNYSNKTLKLPYFQGNYLQPFRTVDPKLFSAWTHFLN